MSFCLQCGASVSPEDRFCGNCGATLQSAAGGGAAPSAGASPAAAEGRQQQQDAPPAAFADASDFAGAGGRAKAAAAFSSSAAAPGDSTDARPSEDLGEQFQPTIIGTGASAPAEPQPETEPDAPPAQTESAQPSPSPQPQEQQQPQPQTQSVPPAPSSEPTAEEEEDASPVELPVESPVSGAREESPGAGRGRGVNTGEADGSAGASSAPVSRTARAGTSASGGSRGVNKQLDPGVTLNNRYEIVRKIGGGGMGAVYYAKDKNLGDAARAVKEMIQSNIDEMQHEKAIADFKRESMLLSSLEHASIPTIYDYFYDESSGAGRFYLVMKYISGGDFLARLRNAPGGRLDELTVADWGAQVADVLHYLHSQRPPIIYRDLKPANLMIDGNTGRVMLIDFGIARWVQKEEKGVTAVGTMGYAPPELFSGKAEARTDIYSLGATMFHLLTGADPQDNPLLIFDFNKHPRPRQINPALSNEMETILMRAVEYEVVARFRSAADMRDVLTTHLEKLRAGTATYGAGAFPGNREIGTTTAVAMVYCGFCGGRISEDDVFCAHCGARQPLASAAASARAARATAKLVVMGTTELNRAFELPKDNNLVGRSDPHSNIFPEIDLSQFDPETKISRRHARIWRQGETYLVEDLGSVNGTVVNDTIRLGPRQPRTLEHGDKLRLGETTLHFLVG